MGTALRRILGGAIIATATRTAIANAILTSNAGAVTAQFVGRASDDVSSLIGYKNDGVTQRWLLNFSSNALNVQVGDVVATQFQVFGNASAVNFVSIGGGATTVGPNLQFTGTDTDVNGNYTVKGAGQHRFRSSAGAATQFAIAHTASSVNYLQPAGAVAGSSPTLSAVGATTDLDILMQPKGLGSLKSSGGFVSTHIANGVGYATGAGGTVTQATSKSTGVTLNRPSGQITMNNAALAAAAKVSFVVTNSAIGANDCPLVSVSSGGTANAYRADVTAIAAGSFTITVENITAGALSEAPVLTFVNIKGATA